MIPTRALALVLLLSGCCGVPVKVDEKRRVVVVNRSGARLELWEAVRDGWGGVTRLADAAVTELRIPPGRYALRLGEAEPGVPLPLPRAELGHVPPEAVHVTVWPWPAADPGWCWVPVGPTLRGDALGIGQEDERPLATPSTAGFFLAERETTNAQFVAFLNALPRDRVDRTWLDLDGAKCRVQRDPGAGRFATDAPELPVVTVSWHGAGAYCRWLSATTGVEHRLPTETEWEKAARGPGSRVYAYGDTYTTARANQESGRLRTGGEYPPNGFGLFDMTGNAFEWTADAYRGPTSSTGDEELRVLRGGSFVLDGIFVRNAMRMRLRPDVRADDVGFRVLRVNTDPRFGPVPGSGR